MRSFGVDSPAECSHEEQLLAESTTRVFSGSRYTPTINYRKSDSKIVFFQWVAVTFQPSDSAHPATTQPSLLRLQGGWHRVFLSVVDPDCA